MLARVLKRALFIGSISACFSQTMIAQTVVQYGTSGTHLAGHIRMTWQYGPPGFGETPRTDPKVKFAYLLLAKPIVVVPAANSTGNNPDSETVKNVRKIRLWCFEKPECKELFHIASDCVVTVEGQLHHGIAPLDFYDITMDIEKMTAGNCSQR
ncbi:hypothetical protein [Edaphobacter sp. 12200R-103]|jgi:hypothetical protein|uniref:hypothetical protein n=1 Tax=Edaphobacter sp. 12200R-103 TaxID=2703788 RepID=UPI00138CA8D5|nr:hypothetical protein [Edaphobacter sp. 12200R-103]QHS50333.1 hypothetical protein GWR55_00135 [Edaphobacter sp. 12200R-103]